MRRRMATQGSWRRHGAAALLALVAFALLTGCGRRDDTAVVEGQLRMGDLNYWLVGTTLVAIGGAQVSGEPSQIGSHVRAEGRRRPDGVVAATRIAVGKAEPMPASLPGASISGAIEALDTTAGRATIAGQAVRFAPGVSLPPNLTVGDRVKVAGATLPDATILASEVARAEAVPTATPTAPARATVAPAPAAPPPDPPEKPKKEKTKGRPGNSEGDDGD